MDRLEAMFREHLDDSNNSVNIERYTKTRDGHLYLIHLLDGKRRSGNGQHDRNDSDTKRVFSVGEGSGR